jgi:erythrin-vacuolar iron transport family protein
MTNLDKPTEHRLPVTPSDAEIPAASYAGRRAGRTRQPAAHDSHKQVLQVVQPALAGMMDGSVSTLAPLFATALATRNSHTAFLVGLAAAVGAGISMAFAEALSDDGSVTGRGNAWVRGLVEGGATLLGGLGHTLPFLLTDVRVALSVASVVVVVELLVISWLRFHYFRMSLVRSALQVVLGGALVFGAGVLIGSS